MVKIYDYLNWGRIVPAALEELAKTRPRLRHYKIETVMSQATNHDAVCWEIEARYLGFVILGGFSVSGSAIVAHGRNIIDLLVQHVGNVVRDMETQAAQNADLIELVSAEPGDTEPEGTPDTEAVSRAEQDRRFWRTQVYGSWTVDEMSAPRVESMSREEVARRYPSMTGVIDQAMQAGRERLRDNVSQNNVLLQRLRARSGIRGR